MSQRLHIKTLQADDSLADIDFSVWSRFERQTRCLLGSHLKERHESGAARVSHRIAYLPLSTFRLYVCLSNDRGSNLYLRAGRRPLKLAFQSQLSIMNLKSIQPYLRHYGRIRTLRGSVLRSTFARVQAGFDEPDQPLLEQAMEALEQADSENLTCVYCGSLASCWDHLVPAARGGTHQVRNLAPCCSPCNLRKGAKTWQEFLDDQPETEATRSAKTILEPYTKGFIPKKSCVSEETTKQLDKILNEILAKLTQADELIKNDLQTTPRGKA